MAPFWTLPEAKCPDCSSRKCMHWPRVVTSVEFRTTLEGKKKKLLEAKQKE